jgi:photosystem II stability/assembly factor-like uncharacterized protein
MRHAMRVIPQITTILFVAVFLCFGWFDTGAAASNPEFHGTAWRPLRIGAGGFVTGLDISPSGSTRVVRTDTYGAYLWNDVSSQWVQLVTASSMPAADVGVGTGAGVYEICVAPNRPSRLYLAYRGNVYRSDDTGRHWTRTSFANVPMNANDTFRTFGQKMAVDPADPNVVYAGTPQNGLFVTQDAGLTWHSVDAVPQSARASNGEYPGITGIVIDPGSSTTGGKTKTIYASSYGNGVYRTTNGGASWTRLDGGPTSASHGKIGADGAYYIVAGDGKSVWRYSSDAWAEITPEKGSWSTVVADPFDPARVVAVAEGGYLDVSRDRGATWSGIIRGPDHQKRRVATDIPWLAWTEENYMSVGDMLFDTAKRDRLWFAEGIGVWYADLPDDQAPPASVTFTSQSVGIEQLVANQILSPPGGKPLVASWDRPIFYVADPDAFPADHGPDNQNAIVMGWALDYASTDPRTIVGIFNWGVEKSGYSSDGGRTWQPFASHPPTIADGKLGGGIAAATPDNIVWSPSNNSPPYYTRDGGATWTAIAINGVPATGDTGWGWAYYMNRHIVAADRVLPQTFYIYNYRKGLYRSTDGGAGWTLVHPGEIAPWSTFNAKLQSVPDHGGHLFFTSGQQGSPEDHHPAANPFMRSTDGGATWTPVANVLEVRAFGFGKALHDYPAIFIAGWVNGQYGIWRSDDDARSWERIGDYPLGILANVNTIEGDKTVYDTVYVGFGGAGYAYGSYGR